MFSCSQFSRLIPRFEAEGTRIRVRQHSVSQLTTVKGNAPNDLLYSSFKGTSIASHQNLNKAAKNSNSENMSIIIAKYGVNDLGSCFVRFSSRFISMRY